MRNGRQLLHEGCGAFKKSCHRCRWREKAQGDQKPGCPTSSLNPSVTSPLARRAFVEDPIRTNTRVFLGSAHSFSEIVSCLISHPYQSFELAVTLWMCCCCCCCWTYVFMCAIQTSEPTHQPACFPLLSQQKEGEGKQSKTGFQWRWWWDRVWSSLAFTGCSPRDLLTPRLRFIHPNSAGHHMIQGTFHCYNGNRVSFLVHLMLI